MNAPVRAPEFTRRRFIAVTGTILVGPTVIPCCGATRADRGGPQPPNTTRLRVRLVDAATGKTTPAMACISDARSSEVRLPPDGRVCTAPSSVKEFMSGVRFEADPNWIGPVRKM